MDRRLAPDNRNRREEAMDEAEDILFEMAAAAELASERAREQVYEDWYGPTTTERNA